MKYPEELFRPSSLARVLSCPGSVKMASELPPLPSSSYADEGTWAHEAAFTRIMTGAYPENTPLDMQAYLDEYIKRVDIIDSDCLLEVKTRHTFRMSGVTIEGTPDCVEIDLANHTLRIKDLKYGRGVKVEAEANNQLIAYAVMVFFSLPDHMQKDINSVELWIIQPRIGHYPTATLTVSELFEYYNLIDETLGRVQTGELDDTFNPSAAACRFCPAGGNCKAQRDSIFQGFPVVVEVADTLTDSELVEAYEKATQITKYADTLKAEMAARIKRTGEDLPGWTLAPGRGRRAWTNETKAAKALRAAGVQPWVKTLISPAQAAKHTDIKALEGLITNKEGADTLTKLATD